tara:strand:+ start:331 stop:486 length:156 start_codon:yes stop_codon:yes gene_type:complete
LLDEQLAKDIEAGKDEESMKEWYSGLKTKCVNFEGDETSTYKDVKKFVLGG